VLDRLNALVALARTGQLPAAPADASGPKGTPVKNMSSSVRIAQRKFITPDVDLSAGDFALLGSGALGFDYSLAYDLKAILPGDLARRLLGRDVARLLATDPAGRVEIPFRLGGTLTQPAFDLPARFLEDRLKARLEREVGTGLERGLQRGLDRLLGGGRRGADTQASPGGSPGPGAAASPDAGAASAAPAGSPASRPDPKQILKDLFK
jgi:hypothetical protein